MFAATKNNRISSGLDRFLIALAAVAVHSQKEDYYNYYFKARWDVADDDHLQKTRKKESNDEVSVFVCWSIWLRKDAENITPQQ